MRGSNQKIAPPLKRQIDTSFYQMITDLKDINEVSLFFNAFFKESELDTFTKRFAITYWLKKGRSYTNIRNNLKVSSATIASVQSEIESKGIQLALKKVEAEEWANVWTQKIQKFLKK